MVPTGEVLAAKQWSFSFSRLEANSGQGFLNVSTFPLTFGVGLGHHTEVFGSWHVMTRLDRDTRPLFFPATLENGTGGGIDVDYPLDRTTFTGSKRGDLWVGAKVNLLPERPDRVMAFAVRPMIKLPIGDDAAGTSSGKADFSTDAILSTEVSHVVDLSGYGGFQIRGNPDGYDLTRGLRWGVGAGFPSRLPVRATLELYGERYTADTITAPSGLTGDDGSPVPTSTVIKSPVYLTLGLTFQLPSGFFVGMGANWNVTLAARDEAAGPYVSNGFRDKADYLIRFGFHPGTRRAARAIVEAPVAPPVVAEVAPAPMPVNGPPKVVAACNPCIVEVGAVSRVSADASDPDGDALTADWRTPAGSLANRAELRTTWTAPMQVGTVPVTVSVSDGKGGTASDTVDIQVIARTYAFEDVHFDFDRYTLLPTAEAVLDGVIAAMKADPALNLTITGRTDNIGTAAYNGALGKRRADSVQRYLTTQGIATTRLSVVSMGEDQPTQNNTREETRMMNRRVVLTVDLHRAGE